jgi:hypothetical protein
MKSCSGREPCSSTTTHSTGEASKALKPAIQHRMVLLHKCTPQQREALSVQLAREMSCCLLLQEASAQPAAAAGHALINHS